MEHDDEFDCKTLSEARGYTDKFFQNSKKNLKVFSAIFGFSDVLYDIVQSKQFDIPSGSTKLVK